MTYAIQPLGLTFFGFPISTMTCDPGRSPDDLSRAAQ